MYSTALRGDEATVWTPDKYSNSLDPNPPFYFLYFKCGDSWTRVPARRFAEIKRRLAGYGGDLENFENDLFAGKVIYRIEDIDVNDKYLRAAAEKAFGL